MLFRDRQQAGRRLADALAEYADRSDLIVLGLPRGGVPVAFEVARALHAPLDVFVVRKLGVPGFPEYAMGAIASGGVRVLNDEVLAQLDIAAGAIERVAATEAVELERRERAFRGTRPPAVLAGRVVVLVDDGLATGATMRAAVRAVRLQRPQRIIVAVPVGAPDSCRTLAREADELVCLAQPEPFFGVGRWFDDFAQTTDAEVKVLLERAGRDVPPTDRRPAGGWQQAGR